MLRVRDKNVSSTYFYSGDGLAMRRRLACLQAVDSEDGEKNELLMRFH